MAELILKGLCETIFMIVASGFVGGLLGIPLAIMLFNSSKYGIRERQYIHHSLGFVVNSIRSIPYIILTVLLIPLSRVIVGSSIGICAAVIPLSICATLLIAKMAEESLKTVPKTLIEVGISMGASDWQIIWKILIPEALPNIISGLTLVLINLVGFSAMAGAVGGGGLGDLAIRYGYQRYNLDVLFIIVVILIILVQLIQLTGNYIANKTKK
jgi:D-methionine transport system permease protein